MKRYPVSGVAVALSLVFALFITLTLYAEVIDCEYWWKWCQGYCQGNPQLVVYSGGGVAVECINSHFPPCPAGYWIQDCR